jgi:SAM-dependent methyltransferase
MLNAYYRWRRPLKIEELVRELESKGFDRIRSKYANPDDAKGWPKYVDAGQWLDLAVKQARFLQLDRRRPVRILDIGSGAGYFLFVCKQFGHSVMGLDLDWPPMYAEMFEMLGMARRVWRIEPFQPLPNLDSRFDLVTGFAVCFNSHGSDGVWGVKEWEFFLDDAFENVVSRTGEIFFELNPEPWGFYTPELAEYFRQRGGWLEGKRVGFTGKGRAR